MNTSSEPVVAVIAQFERLTPESLDQLIELYAPQARFIDPFNDVIGRNAIRAIFVHMFEALEAPRFEIRRHLGNAEQAMLIWEFRFTPLRWHPGLIQGSSHLLFDPQGRITLHRDYWDAAAEFHAYLPGIGLLMRWLRQRLQAPGSMRA
jgi:steroid Delta-isomerase